MTSSEKQSAIDALVRSGWDRVEAFRGMEALDQVNSHPGISLVEIKATVFMGIATKHPIFESALAEYADPLARKTIAALITIELSA